MRLAQIVVCTDCSEYKEESLLSSAAVLMKTSPLVIIYANAIEVSKDSNQYEDSDVMED